MTDKDYTVKDYISKCGEEYSKHPFWKWFDDSTNKTDKIKILAKCIGGFILLFPDINNYIITYDNPENKYEKAINEHAKEDSTHYFIFMEDCKKLGITDLGDLLINNKYKYNKKLTYDICDLITKNKNPIERFFIIESIENTGYLLFSKIVNMLGKDENKYKYFGKYHLDLETGHLVNTTNCDCANDEMFFNEKIQNREYSEKNIDKTFNMFTNWITDIYNNIENKHV
jgi:hypothetical protein